MSGIMRTAVWWLERTKCVWLFGLALITHFVEDSLSKHLLSVGFLCSPMERDSPRVFQSVPCRSLCYCLCPKALREPPLWEGLVLCCCRGLCPWSKEGFCCRYFREKTQKEKILEGGRLWLRDPKLFSWLVPELEQSTDTVQTWAGLYLEIYVAFSLMGRDDLAWRSLEGMNCTPAFFLTWVLLIPDSEHMSNIYVSLQSGIVAYFIMVAEFPEIPWKCHCISYLFFLVLENL